MRLRKTFQGLFGLSGGVGYHLAALVYSRKLWAPFRSQVSAELARILLAGKEPDLSRMHLVIIGASGGYCLDSSFLDSFKRVTAVDIDPLAVLFFRGRFLRQDFFEALEEVEWSLERWWARHAPVTPGPQLTPLFLFSNVLGQLGFLYSDERLKRIEVGLTQAFCSKGGSGTAWVSYHDRLSVPGTARDSNLRTEVRGTSEKLASEFILLPVEVEEHELGGWVHCARGEYTYLAWRLNSARTQIIEICGAV